MLFVQTAAPTGWTKSTAHDNKALRVVSGTAGSGGSVAFTTAFASKTPSGSVSVTVGAGSLSVNNTTLAESQMPSHNHYYAAKSDCYTYYGNNLMYSVRSNSLCNGNYQTNMYSSSTGGSGAHNHGISGSPSVSSSTFTGTAIDLAVQYVDTIIATKD
jgi:microcystin-dependent protein